MAEHPLFGLELPLKLLVWDDGERVRVAARMNALAQRYGIAPTDPRIAAMDHALVTQTATVA